MREFGLIGRRLTHSFSKEYFSRKFKDQGITDASYSLFELDSVVEFENLIANHPQLSGLNVTIPYKEAIIEYLNEVDSLAGRIGAVNTIKFDRGKMIGYNTDYYGFRDSLQKFLGGSRPSALILGSGGAAKAVIAGLEDLELKWKVVSRTSNTHCLSYADLTEEILDQYTLLINTTPLGMYPNVQSFPEVPFQYFTSHHMVYDLVYNPKKTVLMQIAQEHGCRTKNGLEMLELQAEKAWEIWNS